MKFLLCLLVLLPLAYCASIEEKRFLFSKEELVAQLKGILGSDATEAACEQECHVLAGSFGSFLCPLACQALQAAAT